MKSRTILIILITIMTLSINASSKIAKPDFAFPKTVMENADEAIEKALKSNDAPTLVKSMVQHSLAQSVITTDSYGLIIEKIDSIIGKSKDLAAKQLLISLKAQVVDGYFAKNRYKFGHRQESSTERPDDINEWSEEQVVQYIRELTELSTSRNDKLKSVSTKQFADALTYNERGLSVCQSLADVLDYRAFDILINKENGKDAAMAHLNAIAARNAGNADTEIYIHSLSDIDFAKCLSLYNKYSDNELSALLLMHIHAGNKDEEASALLDALNDYLAKHPKSDFASSIRSKKADILEKSVVYTLPSQVSTLMPITVDLRISNVDKIEVILLHSSSNDNRINYSQCRVVDSKTITVDKGFPFYGHRESVTFAPQTTFGKYSVTVKYHDSKGNVVTDTDYLPAMVVSNIAMFDISYPGLTRLFAVDANTGAPLKNVDMSTYERKRPTQTRKTNSEGYVPFKYMPNHYHMEVHPKSGDDNYHDNYQLYLYSYDSGSEGLEMQLLTDLAVYHPGEKVQFAGVLYRRSNGNRKINTVADTEFTIVLTDANNQNVDSIDVTTDSFGRIHGEFSIPTGLMNGTFAIRAKSKELLVGNKWVVSGSKFFEVAEYKAPTFEIVFDGIKKSYPKNVTSIPVKGKVATYSGVPLANQDVEIELSKSQWSFFRINNSGEFIDTLKAITNNEGEFSIDVPRSVLEAEDDDDEESIWFFPRYIIKATVTSNAGETHDTSASFIIGSYSALSLIETGRNIDATQPQMLPVKIETSEETMPTCHYSISDDNGMIVLTGDFVPESTKIDFSSVPSGKYTLQAGIDSDSDSKISATIAVYRPTDTSCPLDTALWVPRRIYNQGADGKASILYGSSTDANIYYIAFSETKVISEGWIHQKAGNHHLTLDLPVDKRESFTVKMFSIRKLDEVAAEITVKPYVEPERLNVSIESFRDKAVAGDVERWRISYRSNDGSPLHTAAIFNIYNKAIDAIAQNNFELFRPSASMLNVSINFPRSWAPSNSVNWMQRIKGVKTIEFIIPDIDTYDRLFFSNYDYRFRIGSKPMRSMAMMDKAEAMEEECAVEDAMAAPMCLSKNAAIATGAADSGSDKHNLDNVTLREGIENVALWLPTVESDAEGNIIVEFSVPNANTTWMMRSTAFTRDFLVDNMSREIVVSKPLMVQPNMPRFVRQGDVATFNAVVINADDTVQQAVALIEIFDPTTKKVFASQNHDLRLDANEQWACNMEFAIPDGITNIGYRIKAATSNFSDGEQCIVPVLNTVSPVIESQSFYINPAQTSHSVNLTGIPSDAKVSLIYCDNPAWTCITALPSMFSTSWVTAPSMAHTLFAIYSATGIVDSNPGIKNAIEYWKQNPDNTELVSPLQKNDDLKQLDIAHTPWLRESERQTLRMQNIVKLADANYTKGIKDEAIKSLKALQNSDGGWKWYTKCEKSSYWVSMEVLELIGTLKQVGYYADDDIIGPMTAKAIAYIDREVVRLYNEQRNKRDYNIFCQFAYVRTLFADIPMSSTLQELVNRAYSIMANDWKKCSLAQKSFIAELMCRIDRKNVAADIVESIKQFAITTANKGTYWDNVDFSWRGYADVSTTARLLKAIAAINPADPIIDSVRQWMVLEKQTNDWGDMSMAPYAISALLNTGTKWSEASGDVVITIGDTTVDLSEIERHSGYIVKEINTPAEGSTLTVSRNGKSPAFGAVMAKFSAPMKQIKAKKGDGIEISKAVYTLKGSQLKDGAPLNVGDRVRVMLTVKSKQPMEFVTITDERCATMEPADQLSDYVYRDGIWMYQETKNAGTNLFIGYLPKGTHCLYYDVVITSSGTYTIGKAAVQCQYAPQFTAHSAGGEVKVD